MAPKGQAETHSPQPMQRSLSIWFTPRLFLLIACVGQTLWQGGSAHCLQVIGKSMSSDSRVITLILEREGLNIL